MLVKYEFTIHVVDFDEHLSLHGISFSHGATRFLNWAFASLMMVTLLFSRS